MPGSATRWFTPPKLSGDWAIIKRVVFPKHGVVIVLGLYLSTLYLKKVSHLMFVNNFDKCGPIFKILSPVDSLENSL